ncbi:MAG: hypothetical protein HUJ88_11405 [Fusobacterium necrophorum]|nr:hypothetical protein [Fusobacterium necrophorum]
MANYNEAIISGENNKKKFYIESYAPDREDIEELSRVINKINYFEDESEVITYVEKVVVHWDYFTDDYNFYKIQKFNSEQYAVDLEDDDLREIEYYIEYDYICVEKSITEKAIEELDTYEADYDYNYVSLELERCKNQEDIDKVIDNYFIEKFMKNDKEYEVEYTEDGVEACCIGNGMYGYIAKGKRFETKEEAIEYLEDEEV